MKFNKKKLTGKAAAESNTASHGCHNPFCYNPEHMKIESHAENLERNSHKGGGYIENPSGEDIYMLDECQCATRCPKVINPNKDIFLVRGDQNWAKEDRDKYCYAKFAGLPCDHFLPAEAALAEAKKQ